MDGKQARRTKVCVNEPSSYSSSRCISSCTQFFSAKLDIPEFGYSGSSRALITISISSVNSIE